MLREELTLSDGSDGDLRCVLQKIAAARPQGGYRWNGRAIRSMLLATVIIAFWCLISGTIVVMGFNSACIEACSLSWPFPSPGHPVKD
jgi:hypothetical protein